MGSGWYESWVVRVMGGASVSSKKTLLPSALSMSMGESSNDCHFSKLCFVYCDGNVGGAVRIRVNGKGR